VKPHNAKPGVIRFPLGFQLRYKAASTDMAVFGVGRTNVISSTELFFTAEHALECGMKAEIYVAWPVLLDGRARLQLILEGNITRTEGRLAALTINKYYFRTRGPWSDAEQAEAQTSDRLPVYGRAIAATALSAGA